MFYLFKAKYAQATGKLRRFLLAYRKHYLPRQLARRQGECRRCGACCRLLFKCPFLQIQADGATHCRIHRRKPGNCQIFPINEKDLRDRDLYAPESKCGFYFENK
ncbi:MAG: hypothetical protein LBP75_03245 [Planctomycetota bacterium]|nr:hypothetical protein [Planctomycetota bacterium]